VIDDIHDGTSPTAVFFLLATDRALDYGGNTLLYVSAYEM
jgi:hypothetical protein